VSVTNKRELYALMMGQTVQGSELVGEKQPLPPMVDVKPGQRNDSLARYLGAQRHYGASDDELLTYALGFNQRISDPLPLSEVQAVARSVTRYEPTVERVPPEQELQELPFVGMDEFCARDFPPVTPIIGPVNKGAVSLFGGSSGVGKSHFAMAMAVAAAGGHRLGAWQAHGKSKVLLVDGELSGGQLQRRRGMMLHNDNFTLLSNLDMRSKGMGRLNLMLPQHRALLAEQAAGYDLVLLDNLFGLFPTTEKLASVSVEHWQQVDDLLSQMKSGGPGVALFDHMAEYQTRKYPDTKKGPFSAAKLQGSTAKRWAADYVGVMLRDELVKQSAPPQFLLSCQYAAGGKIREEWDTTIHEDRHWMMLDGWFTCAGY
jgi:hypothetical protein